MLVYELSDPSEVKYGGTLTPSEQARCFRQTLLESPLLAPYQRRGAQVENICGKLVSIVPTDSVFAVGGNAAMGPGCSSSVIGEGGSGRGSLRFSAVTPNPALNGDLRSVCFRHVSSFGQQYEFFHVCGHVTARCTPGLPKTVIFKGVRGVWGLERLVRDLMLEESTTAQVHMGVVGCFLGVRLQTSQCCYLENKINGGCEWLRVEPRLMDQCNVVRLSVTKWDHHTPPLLPEGIVPLTNDMVLTGRGSMMHRFTWASLVWDGEVERRVLDACDRVARAISELC